ncbi:protein kinase STUNTED isoform X2 [Physcomitrium patens]|uniref:Protein kinase domain-containing protein n=2 Tax=Physcomitrium patens TaxID=3218 RepID=A0A7I4CRQ3_PHYPA|nr:probable receptor-like serine/threonine-protein kinase At5g57670 isoform X2 [Physcomitrium patens]|eukprot:XP_024365811.1 probable receptor-like serine/threonine-protein kinase At5g57670 isoform X2 [Physcomitrella patens]
MASRAALRIKPEGAGGRRLLVGLKLNTSCRKMLTWTIAKLAQPGDHILALHVSSLPLFKGATNKEEQSHVKRLANTLRGVLSVYESLCNLKQINLQLEIVIGYKVRHVLVEVARSYEAHKLILGNNGSFSVGLVISQKKALGRYCLRRLPCTCTVVILDQGEIIFDKAGTLGADMTKLDMIKVFRRSMRFGRHKKLGSSVRLDESEETGKPTVGKLQTSCSDIPHYQQSVIFSSPPCADRDLSFGSCSSALQEDFSNTPVLPSERRNSTSGFEALRISFSKRRAQGTLKAAQLKLCAAEAEVERSDMFLLQNQDSTDMTKSDNLYNSYPQDSVESEQSVTDSEMPRASEDGFVPGWPLLHQTMGFEKKIKPAVSIIDRDLSVVKWALQLPKRGHDPSPFLKESRDEALEIRTQVMAPGLSLAQEVGCLFLNRPCTAFAYEDLETATSRFSQDNLVGRGGGSEVFRGNLQDGKVVAVKRLNHGPQSEVEFLIDIEMNTALTHPNIISLIGYCVESSHMLLVYEYLPEGNLEDQLYRKEGSMLSWEVRHKVAVGIAKALDYLHKGCARPAVHRDVKTSNILLTANFESQLSDFGLAKWLPTKASYLLCNDVVGTFGYLAPEYFMYGRVNEKTDVFAFGVVLLELITGRKPIDTTRPKGEENLVKWARPLLSDRAVNRLVDPQLQGVYDAGQMNNMLIAAFLCIQQSTQRRAQMSRILHILRGDHDEALSTCSRSDEPEEFDSACDGGAQDYSTHEDSTNDIRSHLALAMMGVEDDATSQCSVDLSSVDIPHSNKELEEYLEGRFSRSASFED